MAPAAATQALVSRRAGSPLHPLWARHRVDVGAGDLAFALASCITPGDGAALSRRVEQLASPGGGVLAALSVRSAFDLLLDALAFPEGSELVMSAITIPDMARIAEAHGLRVVPAELDVATLAPTPEALERAIGPRTCAIMVAHLFGGRMDLEPVLDLARRHGLPVIEDCAQAFLGPGDWGHPRALASLFSFGTIKTSTALGGALAFVRDASLLERMRGRSMHRPRQSRRAFAARAARFLALSPIGDPRFFGALHAASAALGLDVEQRLQSAVKGFPGGPDQLLAGIRRRPSAPLLALLARRLERFDRARLDARAAYGERLRAALGDRMPGGRQPLRTHWLVPVLSRAPQQLIATLRRHGFDAAQGTTSLAAVGGAGASWLSRVVYLPAYPEIAPGDFELLCALAAA